jgi:hypothetical protein
MPSKTAAKKKTEPDDVRRARKLLEVPLDLESLLPKLGLREQSALVRRLATSEQADPRRANAWRRLAALMISLAPARPRTVQRAVLFYIPDGKYQQQVFALDDAADGSLVVCCEDMLEKAIEYKLLTPENGEEPGRYLVLSTPYAITIEQLDGKTENPPAYASAMTGWNRRALKMTLPAGLGSEQQEAAELLCAMTALRWVDSLPPEAAKPE